MQKEPAPLHFISPMECLEVDQLPEGELWQYELKLDGYRTIAIKQNVKLFVLAQRNLLQLEISINRKDARRISIKAFYRRWRNRGLG